ncbi:MAG TPA: histidine phosphatase family protein [Pyrinomonadaceae bacterium]|jgi:2,3-bisphosphoglycerate-dependent phosphoglycerate mutase|nr:histidine phosphatase family protein [Pyrinomonadaceae bacterium]
MIYDLEKRKDPYQSLDDEVESLNKTIYLARHCEAVGQAAEAGLTGAGVVQAEGLAELLSGTGIGRIVSSPFVRAVESIEPLARRLGVGIELDERLIEAALSTVDHPDWLAKLRDTFSDFELAFEGGESSQAATTRGIAAVKDALALGTDPIAVVTHGRLLTLILKHFDPKYGFEEWQALKTPDVFRVEVSDEQAAVSKCVRVV